MLWFSMLLGYMFLTLAAHAAICHFVKCGTTFAKFIIVASIAGFCMILQSYFNYGISLELIAQALTYAFICELYIFIFTFISSSISVSILLLVAKNNISLHELSKTYCGKVMVNNRLKKMYDIGLLVKAHNTLILSQKGYYLVKRFKKLRYFFHFDPKPL